MRWRAGLLSTLSPKNVKPKNCWNMWLLACCPHYPPKTKTSSTVPMTVDLPAVHTIPQKHFLDAPNVPYFRSLLSTLSPKNEMEVKVKRERLKACCPHYPPKTVCTALKKQFGAVACCPHYPPKTWKGWNLWGEGIVPAVHTIPQKQAKSVQSRCKSLMPAVHTIPQKPKHFHYNYSVFP